MKAKSTFFLILSALGALIGLIFSYFSTADFAKHLDRQIHTINCSLLPGITEVGLAEESGCRTAMMSEYSSLWREKYWGGIPVSLPAVGIFLFALVTALWALLFKKGGEKSAGLALAVTGLITVGASIFFFFISVEKLQVLCKVCAGIYLGSVILFVGGLLTLIWSFKSGEGEQEGGTVWKFPLLLVQLALFTFLPVYVYAKNLPDYDKYVLGCGELKQAEDKYNVQLPIKSDGSKDALFVIDPLCPACKVFHSRLKALPEYSDLKVRILLLPLDKECNWMLSDSLHPGACFLSKALLCAKENAMQVLDFIYENQEEFRVTAMGDINKIRKAMFEKFPGLSGCVDSKQTKILMNNVLHHAVKLSLPLLTPQLYIEGSRLCDEDTDLGLKYALKKIFENRR